MSRMMTKCRQDLAASRFAEREWRDRALDKTKEVDQLNDALLHIAKAEGRYSRDPLTHASNTIEDMVAIANKALAGEWEVTPNRPTD